MTETVPQIFFKTAEKNPSRVALRYKKNGKFSETITWAEWAKSVRSTARALSRLGVQRGDRVGILAENSPAWTFSDLGSLVLGAVVVPVYPTLSSSDLSFIIKNSGMKVLFVSTTEQLEKVRVLGIEVSHLKIVTFFENPPSPFRSLLDISREASEQSSSGGEAISSQPVNAEDLATIIYTSGTTGTPKGVMLTHSNFVSNYRGAAERIKISENDVALSFLPLSHVFERLAGYYFMAFSGAEIVYAESMLTVAEDIKQVRPTVAAAVPRFYEKVYAVIQAKLQKAGPLSRKIFETAISFRKKYYAVLQKKESKVLHLRILDKIFDWIVFSKVRAGVGGRIRFFISGGAPLSRELAEFFYLCGVLILEGYGLTETSPVIAANTESEFRFGTVGKLLSNVQVKIAEDGEILTSGPCVMKGYFENPEATADVVQNGWFHTGDIGEYGRDGFLKITDRKKDLIVTAGGKKVAPQMLERLVMKDPLFTQVVALGDQKPYIVALVVLNRELAAQGASSLGLSGQTFETWLSNSKFCDWVLSRVLEQTQGVARYESIKSIAIIPQEFSIQRGELTPTLKVKRRFVMEKYAAYIDKLYL